MKITKAQLRKIIREAVSLTEQSATGVSIEEMHFSRGKMLLPINLEGSGFMTATNESEFEQWRASFEERFPGAILSNTVSNKWDVIGPDEYVESSQKFGAAMGRFYDDEKDYERQADKRYDRDEDAYHYDDDMVSSRY